MDSTKPSWFPWLQILTFFNGICIPSSKQLPFSTIIIANTKKKILSGYFHLGSMERPDFFDLIQGLHKFLSCIPHYFYLIYYYFNLFNIIFTRLQSIPIVPVILIFSLFHVWAFLIPTFTHMIYVTWLVSSLLSSQFPDQIILSLSSLSWLIQPEGWVLLWGCEHINKLCN